ncbi:MAG TPA: DUF92 domain-containing protein [Terriglobales bacterium]|nr:DUF92 domain-containing protein [Terriglobales bacterium]
MNLFKHSTEFRGALAWVDPRYGVFVPAIITLVFSSVAWLLRGVTTSGAIAGAFICFLVYTNAGFGAFAALVTVFFLAWLATRFGYSQKQRLGIAEKREGRTALQVLANLGFAAICAGIYFISHLNRFWLLGLAAALSEAAADTVSSEIGQAIGAQPRLITTWRPVSRGSDGGVSLQGTLAGIAAAAIVSLVCVFGGLISWCWFGISVAAATSGMLADSLLGATFERRRILNNDGVNFLSTAVAVVIGCLFVRMLAR